MKMFGKWVIYGMFALLFSSCVTTGKMSGGNTVNEEKDRTGKDVQNPQDKKEQEKRLEEERKKAQARKEAEARERERKETERKKAKEKEEKEEQNLSSKAEKEFINAIQGLNLEVVSSPRSTRSGRAFASQFAVSVKDEEGKPVVGASITALYPSSRSSNAINYTAVRLVSDEKGVCSFMPPVTDFGVKDRVTFYPTPINSSASVMNEVYALAVEIPFLVKSTIVSKPCMLFAYEFNESGSSLGNSFKMLQALRNSGIAVGNAPLSSASYFNKPLSTLYKDTYEVVGRAYDYLIVISIRWTKPAFEENGKVCVSLSGDLNCIYMKNGEIVNSAKVYETGSGKNRNSAENAAKEALINRLVDAVIYGM